MAQAKRRKRQSRVWLLCLGVILFLVLIVESVLLLKPKDEESASANSPNNILQIFNSGLRLSKDLRPVILNSAYTMVPGGSTEDGFYYIESRPENSMEGNIRYVDYKTHRDVFLSNQVNSDHASELDPSFLDSLSGSHTMFCSQDKLYFLRGGMPAGETMGKTSKGGLYQMNLDGSNRKCLYEADASVRLETDVIADDENLYLFECSTEGVNIVQIPVKGGEIHTVPLNGFSSLAYCEGSRIYYYKVDMESGELTLTICDFASGENTALDIPVKGTAVFVNDRIYTFGGMHAAADPAAMRTAKVYDFQGRLLETLDLSPILPEQSWGCNMPKAVGDKILWMCWNDQTKSYYTAVLDTVSNEMSTTFIPCLFDKNGEQQPAEIIAQAGDDFLIVTHRAERSVDLPYVDGSIGEFIVERYEKVLIPQADYFSGNTENIQKITAE